MSEEIKSKIIEAYRRHILTEGERPKSVFAFCESLEIEEALFYEFFSNFDSLEVYVWKELFRHAIRIVEEDESAVEYSARERYLAFSFTLVEQMKKHLSYYRVAFGDGMIPPGPGSPFAKALGEIDGFTYGVMNQGHESGEIAKRAFLEKLVTKGFQFHVVFVIKYFMKDTSEGFSKTDQAIEKSTHLLFDGLGKGVVDSAFDFVKFMGQNAFA